MSTTTSRPRRAAVRVSASAAASPAVAPFAEIAQEASAPSAATPTPPPVPTAAPPPDPSFLRRLHLTRVDRLPCFFESDASAESAADRRLAAAEHAAALTSAVREPENRSHAALLRRVLRRGGRPAAAFRGVPQPEASAHSETEQWSVLRTDWSTSAAQWGVDWSRPEMKLELTLGADVVFSGGSSPVVVVDGRPLEPTGTWEEVVRLAEPEADYLELEIRLSGGVRLQRQMLLARRDGWLYVGDDVHTPSPATIETRLQLPTVAGARLEPADETREARLRCGKRRLAVVPASLPEWRCEPASGELVFGDLVFGERPAGAQGLELRQSADAVRVLNSALLLNFDPRRAARDVTWRRLTVGEHLRIVRSDEAVGYRLQLGREHWLLYRSLTDWANRTLLGVNLQTAFLFARFSTDGESEPLIELDS